jgi:hypothetical protein
MTTEDFVPFETAVLMREKGFDTPCDEVYDSDGNLFNIMNKPLDDYEYCAPTLAVALKWLRETHGLYADVFVIDYAPEPWVANIHRYNDEIELVSVYRHNGEFFRTYEDAANFIIKVCLEKFL